jgi:hypothetical protein
MSINSLPTISQGTEATANKKEDAIAEANALIYLMSCTLAYLTKNDDSGATAMGLIQLDARVRKNLVEAE